MNIFCGTLYYFVFSRFFCYVIENFVSLYTDEKANHRQGNKLSKFIKFTATAVAIISLSGCLTTANLIKAPNQANTDSKYAPESEKRANGIGVVNYLNEGILSIRNARREDAYKKAFEACDGKYEILDERSNYTDPMYITSQSSYSSDTYNTYSVQSEYRYIYFRCS